MAKDTESLGIFYFLLESRTSCLRGPPACRRGLTEGPKHFPVPTETGGALPASSALAFICDLPATDTVLWASPGWELRVRLRGGGFEGEEDTASAFRVPPDR